MGAWGYGLYDNDSTSDVRDTYIELLEDGLDNIQAYEKTLENLQEYIGDEDEPLLWFALAEAQWSTGRLMQEVKEKALSWIEKEGGIELWEEDRNGSSGWRNTLSELKTKLESPMRKEKKFRKTKQIMWELNDVYAYQFLSDDAKEVGLYGKYMLIQKIGEAPYYKGEIYMQVQLIDHVFCELPKLEDVNNYRILPADNLQYIRPLMMNCSFMIYKKSDYPHKQLTYLGNIQGPSNKVIAKYECLFWSHVELYLKRFYTTWQDREYRTIEDGIYSHELK